MRDTRGPQGRALLTVRAWRHSATGDGHLLDQHRAGADIAATLEVTTDCNDLTEHVAQIAGDGYLLHRELDLAVLDPEARRATGLVTGNQVQALPHQFGDQQTAAHATNQRLLIFIAMGDEQVVHTAGVGGAR